MNVLKQTLKEIVRHLVTKTGADTLLNFQRKVRGISTDYLNGTLAERFSQIYATGAWSKAGKEKAEAQGPGSGLGSSLDATANIRSQLPQLLQRLGTVHVIDIGCGDFTWMSSIDLATEYCGVDIVRDVIETNRDRYAKEGHTFHCLDASKDELPDGDTVLCREVIFHLSFADIFRTIDNISRKPRKYFIATTDTATLFNADIRSGDFRTINLRRPPFSLPAPCLSIQDAGIMEGRILGVWQFQAINEMLERVRSSGR